MRSLSIVALVMLAGATVESWAPVFDSVRTIYLPDDQVGLALEGQVHGQPTALYLDWDLDGCLLVLTLSGGGLSYTQSWPDVCGVDEMIDLTDDTGGVAP